MKTMYVTRKDLLKWRQDTEVEDIDIHDFMRRAKEIAQHEQVIFCDTDGKQKILKNQKTLIRRLYESFQ